MNTALQITPRTEYPQAAKSENMQRLMLITGSEVRETDVFALFGWSDLPDSLRDAVRSDMEAYRDELLGLYSTCDNGVRNRRKSVSYWIRAYRDGICSEQTAVSALRHQ